MEKLLGDDNRGRVYRKHNQIFRMIRPEFANDTLKILKMATKNQMFSSRLVATRIVESSSSDNELVLSHQSMTQLYPHEWSVQMVVDAAICHLELAEELKQHQLLLKDALPNNYLFSGASWQLVDFCSIIQAQALQFETWLKGPVEKRERNIYKKMFIPFFLIPMTIGAAGSPKRMRFLFERRYCNSQRLAPNFLDLLRSANSIRNFGVIRAFARAIWVIYFTPIKQVNSRLLPLILRFRQSQLKSNYLTYYCDKSEFLSDDYTSPTNQKQRVVQTVLEQQRPKTVIDLGSNTGLYSLMAARMGAMVYSIDSDDAAIDALYSKVRNTRLDLFSIVGEFAQPETSRSTDRFLPLHDRISGDLVLCLGLLHHLVLGLGLSMDYIFSRIMLYKPRSILVEYVELNDEKIADEPSFFPQLRSMSGSYSLIACRNAGLKFFSNVQVEPSHPHTRSLLLFSDLRLSNVDYGNAV